jgi:hypothetical protein
MWSRYSRRWSRPSASVPMPKADQVRSCDEPQNRQDARPDDPRIVPLSCRRGDRIILSSEWPVMARLGSVEERRRFPVIEVERTL